MINRIKSLFKRWQAERRRNQFLHINLAKLSDETFLDRVHKEEMQ